MKEAVRESIAFLSEKLDMDRAVALAYLSAATDYEVSQVVDRTKGVHALIEKRDFLDRLRLVVKVNDRVIPSSVYEREFYVALRPLVEALGGTVQWDAVKKAALAVLGDKTITVMNASSLYQLNGKTVSLNTDPILMNGKMMVPFTVLDDIFALKTNWTTRGLELTATITK
jgi:hypothetical protein